MSFGGAPKCGRCGKSVYFAEEAIACGKKWHKSCLLCKNCNKRLDSTTCTDHDGEIYCKSCHGKLFGPKGYGFAGGSSGLSMDTGKANEVTRDNVPRGLDQARVPHMLGDAGPTSKFGGADKCPKCGRSVYKAEEVLAAGRAYHKSCFTCLSCNKSLDSVTVTNQREDIYCKACYNKNFGPKGFGFGAAMQRTT
ncbi:cysteine and glycine-rich protein 2-like [Liolophura sinensis]|uniref:cysteine and glycine-rich protein 2-like n=1 Tax=Liolophura sinensis TaxID=3198878 RepID=UPI00315864E6